MGIHRICGKNIASYDGFPNVELLTKADMSRLGDLFDVQPATVFDQPYPIVFTFTPDGPIDITVPNFPNIIYYGPNLQDGLILIREDLQEAQLTCIIPPQPIPVSEIPVGSDQQVRMITPSV